MAVSEKNPIISIYVPTFNHEKYIAKAIDSILMQKVDFDYEIVIGEDFSIDNTRNIILEYFKENPGKFRIILQKSNVGGIINVTDILNECTGKYFAALEGDDYWTDELKLQKQVDFLEANPDYGLVYTDFNLIDEEGNIITESFFNTSRKKFKSGYLFFDLLQGNFIPTLTTCYRASLLKKYTLPSKYLYDYWVWLILSMQSKFHYLEHKTANYRVHNSGFSRNDSFFDMAHPLVKYDIIKKIYDYFSKLLYYEKKILFFEILNLIKNRNFACLKKFKLIITFVKILIFR